MDNVPFRIDHGEPRRAARTVILHEGRVAFTCGRGVMTKGHFQPILLLIDAQLIAGVCLGTFEDGLNDGEIEPFVLQFVMQKAQRRKTARMTARAPVLEAINDLVAVFHIRKSKRLVHRLAIRIDPIVDAQFGRRVAKLSKVHD